jgi:pilus assembly protein Flp/PilA
MIEKLQFMTLMFLNDLKTKHAERDERGATAVEYGLLVALIAAVIVGAVGLLGDQLVTKFNEVLTAIGGTPEAPAAG